MTLTGLHPSAATHALNRLSAQGLLTKIKRGLWLTGPARDVSSFELLPFLAAPWPAYVSLYSALSQYSVIEEVPHVVYGVTSGRPAKIKTPLGAFHLHHLPPRLIWGYQAQRTAHGIIHMAEPEKAFLDLIYLSLIPRSPLKAPQKRGRQWNLNPKTLRTYAEKFNFIPLKDFLRKSLNRI